MKKRIYFGATLLILAAQLVYAGGGNKKSLKEETASVKKQIAELKKIETEEARAQVVELTEYLQYITTFFTVARSQCSPMEKIGATFRRQKSDLPEKVDDRLRGMIAWLRQSQDPLMTMPRLVELRRYVYRNKSDWREAFEKKRAAGGMDYVPRDFVSSDGELRVGITLDRDGNIYLDFNKKIAAKGMTKALVPVRADKSYTPVARLKFDPQRGGGESDSAFLRNADNKYSGFEDEKKLLQDIRHLRKAHPERTVGLAETTSHSSHDLYQVLYDGSLTEGAKKGRLGEYDDRLDGAIDLTSGLINLRDHFGRFDLDVKPDNILYRTLEEKREFVHTDFGLSFDARLPMNARYPVRRGSPFAMAPEILRGRAIPFESERERNRLVDRASTYSLALSNYFLLENGKEHPVAHGCDHVKADDAYADCRDDLIRQGLRAYEQNSALGDYAELLTYRALYPAVRERIGLDQYRAGLRWIKSEGHLAPSTLPISREVFQREFSRESIAEADLGDLQHLPAGTYGVFYINGNAPGHRVGLAYLNYEGRIVRKEFSSEDPARIRSELEFLKQIGVIEQSLGSDPRLKVLSHYGKLAGTSHPLVVECEGQRLKEEAIVGCIQDKLVGQSPRDLTYRDREDRFADPVDMTVGILLSLPQAKLEELAREGGPLGGIEKAFQGIAGLRKARENAQRSWGRYLLGQPKEYPLTSDSILSLTSELTPEKSRKLMLRGVGSYAWVGSQTGLTLAYVAGKGGNQKSIVSFPLGEAFKDQATLEQWFEILRGLGLLKEEVEL